MMQTILDVVRAAIPNADERLADHVLWGRAPYPMGKVTARSIFKAASRLRRAGEHGIRLCDWCDRPVGPLCEGCDAALHGPGSEQLREGGEK